MYVENLTIAGKNLILQGVGTAIYENSADIGGGLYLKNCGLTFYGVDANCNSSNKGGFIYNSGGSWNSWNCTYVGNTASLGGGAYNYNTSIEMYSSVFTANSAQNGGGMYNTSSDSNATVFMHGCLMAGNTATSDGGALCNISTQCSVYSGTIAQNSAPVGNAIFNQGSNHRMMNTICWGDEPFLIYNESGARVQFYYCDIKGSGGSDAWDISLGTDEGGNIDQDPLFAALRYWDDNGTPDDKTDDAWVHGDYHLRSNTGRRDPKANDGAGAWVQDNVLSPCIDAGDPATGYANEPQPNASRINMGAYGNTEEASKSGWKIPGDANGDCKVNIIDLI